LRYTSVK